MKNISFICFLILSITITKKLKSQYSGMGGPFCRNLKIAEDYKLSGECMNQMNNYAWRAFTLNLNTCFGNSSGTIKSQANGNYAGSCFMCRLEGTWLKCTCQQSGTTVLNEYA